MDKNKPKIDWKCGDVAVVREHWEGAGSTFDVIGPAVFVKQWWVPIIDKDDESEPTFHKEAGLFKKDK